MFRGKLTTVNASHIDRYLSIALKGKQFHPFGNFIFRRIREAILTLSLTLIKNRVISVIRPFRGWRREPYSR